MLRRKAKTAEGSAGRLLRNTAANAVGSSIGVLVTLLLTPLLIDRLGTSAYGVWILATTFTFGLGYLSFADLGIEYAAVRYMAEARSEGDMRAASSYMSSAFALLLGIAAVLTPVLILLSDAVVGLFSVPQELESAAVVTFAFVIAQLAFELPNRAFTGALQASQRFGVLQVGRMIQTLLVSGAMAAVVLTDHGI